MSNTRDFGVSPKRRRPDNRHIAWAMLGGGLLFVAAAVYWDIATRQRTISVSSDQTNVAAIGGPPCPALSLSEYRSALKSQGPLPYVFEFNGATFGRDFGYADCSVAAAKGSMGLVAYDVCQFTSPALLYVKTPRGEFYFKPGVGQRATIMTPDGTARCVMAAPAED